MKSKIIMGLMIIIFPLVAWAQTYISSSVVNIRLVVSDSGSGMGDNSMMSFSNDGITWSPPEKFQILKTGWDLNDVQYGGTQMQGEKRVWATVSDDAGNWSSPLESNPVIFDNNGPILENVIIEIPIVGGTD